MAAVPQQVRLAVDALDQRVRGVDPATWLMFLQALVGLFAVCPRPVTPADLRRWLLADDVWFDLFGRRRRVKAARKAWFIKQARQLWPGVKALDLNAAEAVYLEAVNATDTQLKTTVESLGARP